MADEAATTQTDTTAATTQATDTAATTTLDASALDGGTLVGGDAKTAATTDAATTEAKTDGAETQAVAGAPEAYELKAPEGAPMQIDAEMVKLADPVFRELNLTNDQAQKLTDFVAKDYLPKVLEQVKTQGEQETLKAILDTRKAWVEQTTADAEVGGNEDQRKERAAVMATAIDKLMGDDAPAFRQFLNDTGLGNHVLLAKLAYRAGKMLQEGQIHTGGPGTQVKTPEQSFYGPTFQPPETQ